MAESAGERGGESNGRIVLVVEAATAEIPIVAGIRARSTKFICKHQSRRQFPTLWGLIADTKEKFSSVGGNDSVEQEQSRGRKRREE